MLKWERVLIPNPILIFKSIWRHPPPVVVPPKSKTLGILRTSSDSGITDKATQLRTFCAREVEIILVSRGSVTVKRYVVPSAVRYDEDYIVVGLLGNDECLPNEVKLLVRKSKSEDLFKQIRRATRKLRPLPRRLLSLKRVSGFAIYQCYPTEGYHRVPVMDSKTKRTIQELYRDYRTLDKDYGHRWLDWIHLNFNNGSLDPANGTYSLQLVLSWSPVKIIFWGIAPIILSLAIGLWYMLKPTPNEDFLTVVQTAWAIASYIVTAGACELPFQLLLPAHYTAPQSKSTIDSSLQWDWPSWQLLLNLEISKKGWYYVRLISLLAFM